MTASSNTRVATQTDVRVIAANAAELDYNRQVGSDIIHKLDPEGRSLLTAMMIHEHAHFEKVDPHMRAVAYLKVSNTNEPVKVIIDVPMTDWDALPEAEISYPSDPRNG